MSAEHRYDIGTTPISHRNSVEGSGHKPHANTAEYEKLYKESIQDPTGFWDKASTISLSTSRRGRLLAAELVMG
jgi:hypothetical protein